MAERGESVDNIIAQSQDLVHHLLEELASRVALLEASKDPEDDDDADTLDTINDPENPFKHTTISTDVEEWDIDPEGDVTFVCTATEGKEIKIRVSSKVVALSSRVFKVMLGPHFREGNTLRANAHVEIPLPDDDPKVLAAVFSAFHMRSGELEDGLPLTSSTLVDTALLCDKYEFERGNWPLFYALLWDVAEGHDATFNCDPAGIGDTLIAAAVLKSYDVVYWLGCSALESFKGKIECSVKGDILRPILGLDIFAQLEEHRLQLRASLSTFIEKEVQGLIHREQNYTYSECPSPELSVVIMMRALNEAQLWPSTELAQHSLFDFADAMAKLRPPYPGPLCSLIIQNYHSQNCIVHRDVNAICERINKVGEKAKKQMRSLHFSSDRDWETGEMAGFTMTQEDWYESP